MRGRGLSRAAGAARRFLNRPDRVLSRRRTTQLRAKKGAGGSGKHRPLRSLPKHTGHVPVRVVEVFLFFPLLRPRASGRTTRSFSTTWTSCARAAPCGKNECTRDPSRSPHKPLGHHPRWRRVQRSGLYTRESCLETTGPRRSSCRTTRRRPCRRDRTIPASSWGEIGRETNRQCLLFE